MNECIDCGAKIGFRATRCRACRRIHRTQYERERVAAGREKRREQTRDEPAWEYPPLGEPVVDFTRPGSASKPPSFDNHPRAPRAELREPEVVDYTRGGTNGPRPPAPPDFSRVPASIRHDRVRAERYALDLAQADEVAELSSWEQLQVSGQVNDRLVSFRPAMDGSILRGGQGNVTPSPHMNAILGQAVVRPQPRQKPPGQRVPHMIVN